MRCRQCGNPSSSQYCAACAVWFAEPSPGHEDPYSTLSDLQEPSEPGSRRGRKILLGGLGFIGLAGAAGLALLLGGGPDDDVAAPAATSAPTRPAPSTPDPTGAPTPSTEPTVVVTVTRTAQPSVTPTAAASSPEAAAASPQVTPQQQATEAGPAPEQRFDRYYPLYRGDYGYVVSALQGLLDAGGVRTYLDGDFGSATERSVRQWQAQQGLSVTGVVDDTTWETLTPQLELGSSGAAVTVLQTLLAERGYDIVVDGEFAEQTDAVVRQFQAERGLTVDGVVAQESWPALLA